VGVFAKKNLLKVVRRFSFGNELSVKLGTGHLKYVSLELSSEDRLASIERISARWVSF
jgi:hypothetical protein